MKTIIAAFSDQSSAQQAIDYLHSRGVNDAQLMGFQEGNQLSRFEGLNIPDDRAELYAEVMRRGAPVVLAHTDHDADELARELDNMGSIDLEASANRWRSEGWSGYDVNARPYDADAYAGESLRFRDDTMAGTRGDLESDTRDLDVIEEHVSIGKREVDRGGVRVRTFVTERPVQEEVQLREERIDVNRERVDERISPNAVDQTLTEDEFVVTAKGEEAVVGKEARVVERVHVGKHADTRTETISETERRRDVEVEQLEGGATFRDEKLPRTEPTRRR